jgi:ribosomal protein S15P/S13E
MKSKNACKVSEQAEKDRLAMCQQIALLTVRVKNLEKDVKALKKK